FFRVDVRDFPHDPHGLARFVGNGHGLNPAPENPRWLLEEAQFSRGGTARQYPAEELAVERTVLGMDAVFRKRAGSPVHGGSVPEFFLEAGRGIGAADHKVVFKVDAL